MIEVTYHKRYNRLTVKGHAGSAPVGEDLVCSAASILALTLERNIKQLKAQGVIRNFDIHISEGDAELTCTPVSKYANMVMLMFQSTVTGFQILAEKFPDYISLKIFL